ncbi:hypothetical protein [Rhodobacter maris]|uniref:Uncharacterized protein n=1 Tax=Rhodobacter maris TaxID=446682 RepID=A0A285TCM8_9RHOB|nr:hypothetical protein [Rhodobacter maris]SOC19770.1 hypothetical protein SAMN05877831_11852 [Rhodobacter maris]
MFREDTCRAAGLERSIAMASGEALDLASETNCVPTRSASGRIAKTPAEPNPKAAGDDPRRLPLF